MLGVEAGSVCWGRRVGAGSPFTVPHLIKQSCTGWCGVVGVAGWNTYCCWSDVLGEFDTLLGPEETPVWVCSWCHRLPGCLTHGFLFVGVCVVVVVGLGCGCVLSVA